MKFSMIGQEKCDLLIQVTTWAGLNVYFMKFAYLICLMQILVYCEQSDIFVEKIKRITAS